MNAVAATVDLAPALVVLPGGRAAVCDGGGAKLLRPDDARSLALSAPVIVAHASLTAKRLDLPQPGRSPLIFDALELYAFVRPARFCAPSAVGLALALGWPEPRGVEAQAVALSRACAALLDEIRQTPWPSREEALALAETLARAGWSWGGPVANALREGGPLRHVHRGSGLDVWARIPEWEDSAPPGEAGSKPVTAQAVQELFRSAKAARNGQPALSAGPGARRKGEFALAAAVRIGEYRELGITVTLPAPFASVFEFLYGPVDSDEEAASGTAAPTAGDPTDA